MEGYIVNEWYTQRSEEYRLSDCEYLRLEYIIPIMYILILYSIQLECPAEQGILEIFFTILSSKIVLFECSLSTSLTLNPESNPMAVSTRGNKSPD